MNDWLVAGLILAAGVPIVLLVARYWSVFKPRRGGGMGRALGELNAMFDPSQRHTDRVQEERRMERKDDEPPL